MAAISALYLFAAAIGLFFDLLIRTDKFRLKKPRKYLHKSGGLEIYLLVQSDNVSKLLQNWGKSKDKMLRITTAGGAR